MSTKANSETDEGKSVTAPVLIPDPWAVIAAGSIILCKDNAMGGGGWWPCKVTDVSKDGKSLTVKWEGNGYGDLPGFSIRRTAAALLSAKP